MITYDDPVTFVKQADLFVLPTSSMVDLNGNIRFRHPVSEQVARAFPGLAFALGRFLSITCKLVSENLGYKLYSDFYFTTSREWPAITVGSTTLKRPIALLQTTRFGKGVDINVCDESVNKLSEFLSTHNGIQTYVIFPHTTVYDIIGQKLLNTLERIDVTIIVTHLTRYREYRLQLTTEYERELAITDNPFEIAQKHIGRYREKRGNVYEEFQYLYTQIALEQQYMIAQFKTLEVLAEQLDKSYSIKEAVSSAFIQSRLFRREK